MVDDPTFRSWMLAGTPYAGVAMDATHDGALQKRMRGHPGMTNPYWFNYWCGKDRACTCRLGTAIETDILLVFADDADQSFGVHIEIKRPGDTLGDGQAATYPRRAACWAAAQSRPKRIPEHSGYVTILAGGRNLEGAADIGYFDRVVFHDEIAKHLNEYPERQA